jgi:hypothetical protein
VKAAGTTVAGDVSSAGDTPVEEMRIATAAAIPFIVCPPPDL